MMDTTIDLGGRRIGDGHEPFVIAEMSANHLGRLDRAMEIVEAAAHAGAHALKLQTYTADTLTIESDRPEFQIHGGPWDGHSLHSLYQKAYTPWEWHQPIFQRAQELGMLAFSSPFDLSAVEFLEDLDVPAYKIASFELVDHGLIEACARTGKPLIMSTGLASPQDIVDAVAVAKAYGDGDVVVLHCLSGYPAPVSEFNLRRLAALRDLTGVHVGISDHSLGVTIPVAATALGACVVEKHLTLKRSDGGPDAEFSLEPDEFAQMVRETRTVWKAMGTGQPARAQSEAASRSYRRSLYIVRDVAQGEALTKENTRSIRPSLGLAPKHLPDVLGRCALRPLAKGTPLAWELVA